MPLEGGHVALVERVAVVRLVSGGPAHAVFLTSLTNEPLTLGQSFTASAQYRTVERTSIPAAAAADGSSPSGSLSARNTSPSANAGAESLSARRVAANARWPTIWWSRNTV